MESLRKHRSALIVSLLLAGAVFIAYGQVAGFSFINFDDPAYVIENPHVNGGISLEGVVWAFTSAYEANWHPLTWISHMIDVQLFGMNPGMHHLVNVIIHLGNTMLLFLVFRMMTGALWRSAALAALFALHPLHVESVAWVSERKDVLSTFFWLATMIAYCRYARSRSVWRYGLVVLFFLLGLMSKPMVVTLPFVLLLLDFWPLGRLEPAPGGGGMPGSRGRDVRVPGAWLVCVAEKVPLLVLSGISSWITLYAQREGQAVVSLEHAGLAARAIHAIIAYVTYIEKAFLPVNLSVFYPYYPAYSTLLVALSGLLLVLITVLALIRRREAPYLIVGWLWYLGTLVPVIGIVQVGAQAMADRYTYIPLVGVFLCLVWLAADLAGRREYGKPALGLIMAVLLAVLTLAARHEAAYWKDSETLFRRAIDVTAANAVAHNSLGYTLYRKGDVAGAVKEYREALRYNPRHANAHNNLGAAMLAMGNYDAAIGSFSAALSLSPHSARAYRNLGAAYYRKGDLKRAIAFFHKALQEDPGYEEARRNLSYALNDQKKLGGLVSSIQEKIAQDPHNLKAYLELGYVYSRMGEYDAAFAQYQQALSLDPDSELALNLISRLHADKGEYGKAIAALSELVRLRPGDPGAYYEIACMYARENKPVESVSWLRQALARGFGKPALIGSDPRLDSIRGSAEYRRLMESPGSSGR